MKVGFVLPSCNYNIELSENDLKQLLDKGYIVTRPIRTDGMFKNAHGEKCYTSGHYLLYNDNNGEHPVQYIGLSLEDTRGE